MSNPDEKTAIEQFGKGDKYFGVATVLATLPGLPMLGHGQVQGFGEKYGMEFRRAMLDEQPDPWLVARHEREIFPLLHQRAWFAEAADFLLYDFTTAGRPRRRGRPGLLERLGSRAVAGAVPRPVRIDDRADPPLVAVRGQVPDRRQAKGPAIAGGGPRAAQRSGRVPRVPGLPDGPRIPALVPRDLGAGLRDLPRRLHRPRLLGVPGGVGRRGRTVGQAGRAPGRAGRPVAR